MKILVDKMPKKPSECIFSFSHRGLYASSIKTNTLCTLGADYRCYGVNDCQFLEEIKQSKTAFLCDRKTCGKCSYPVCRHTTDPSHALNFSSKDGRTYFEDPIFTKKTPKTVLKVKEYLPDEEILCQLGEEASELAQAALKYRRVLNGANPTPTSEKTALLNLREEAADVSVCLDLLFNQSDCDAVEKMAEIKSKRWVKRLEEKRANQKEDDSACRTSVK